MILLKPKPTFLAIALFALTTIVIIGCNDSAKRSEQSSASPNDTIDTSKMDTATTRPLKTTN